MPELLLKKIEKVQNLGDYYAIRSMCVVCHISHADSLQISQHAPRGRLPAGRSVMSPAAWSCSPARIRACPCPAGTPPIHALKTHKMTPQHQNATSQLENTFNHVAGGPRGVCTDHQVIDENLKVGFLRFGWNKHAPPVPTSSFRRASPKPRTANFVGA